MAERYRRKSTEISAVQWDGEVEGDALDKIIAMGVEIDFVDFTRTLRIKAGPRGESGWVNVPEGSWVATDGNGDFWPIAAEQFTATYELVEGGICDLLMAEQAKHSTIGAPHESVEASDG